MFDDLPDLDLHSLSPEWSSDLLNYGQGPQNDTTTSADDNNSMEMTDSDVQELLAAFGEPTIPNIPTMSNIPNIIRTSEQQQMAGVLDGIMFTSSNTQEMTSYGMMDGGFSIASVPTDMVYDPNITFTQQTCQVSVVMLILLVFSLCYINSLCY